MEKNHTTHPPATVRLAITVDPLRLAELVREIRAQAPPAEWATIQALAMELLALGEVLESGQAVAVVPAAALKELSASVAVSEPE